MEAALPVRDGEDGPAPEQIADVVILIRELSALETSANREDVKARAVFLPYLDDVPLLDSVERLRAGLLDLHDLRVNNRDVVHAARVFAPEEDNKLGPSLRIMERHSLNVAVLIAERRESEEDARLRPGLLCDEGLHGEPRPVAFDRLALEPCHVPVSSVLREHDLARAGDHALLTHAEYIGLCVVE